MLVNRNCSSLWTLYSAKCKMVYNLHYIALIRTVVAHENSSPQSYLDPVYCKSSCPLACEDRNEALPPVAEFLDALNSFGRQGSGLAYSLVMSTYASALDVTHPEI